MESEHHDGEMNYWVVYNDEDQYSIWPAGKKLPVGWQKNDFIGSREACLSWIKAHWTDIRPKSIKMAESSNLFNAKNNLSHIPTQGVVDGCDANDQ